MTSAPLNATKIAVKKISDVDVCMFVPEFEFSMYKCCLLSCFCASQRVQQRKAELTLAQIRVKLPNGWADNGTKCGTHVQIHMGMDIRQSNYPGDTRGHLAGFRGSAIQKSGKLSYWHRLWFSSTDSSGNGHRLNTSRHSIPQEAFRGVGVRVSQIQKSGEAVKRLDRLAPPLVHVCGIIWEWT